MPLPRLSPVSVIHDRLQVIFPEGTVHRNYVTREIATKTVFVMLYIGAVVGTERWLRPDQVTRMTDEQAGLVADDAREAWLKESMRRDSSSEISGRWYKGNTRESIRDETLREGLIRLGAVRTREGLPTTSSRPRYALAGDFARLFDPGLTGEALRSAIETWRATFLSPSALARVEILRRGAADTREKVPVTFPTGETRNMAPGPSSEISKAVVEVFAPRFLEQPGVIWLSESGNRVVERDDDLARAIGLTIEPDLNLPDLILVDVRPQERAPLLVFVEVVATDGPVSKARQAALLAIATDAGFDEDNVAFVTAFADRDDPSFRKTASVLAWRSFAWFMSEPEHIVALHRGTAAKPVRLSDLM